jgi:hypothetical protein
MTSVIADVVAMFGLPVPARPPRTQVRLMTHLMVSGPERWTLPLVGAGEMVGCVLFRELRDKGVELFGDESAVAELIELLYNEVLADEIGHVGFIVAQLNQHGRLMMRRLYARLSSALLSQFGEMDALFGRAEMVRRFSAFHLADAAAELPNLTFTAAQI